MYSVKITYVSGDSNLMDYYSYGIPAVDPHQPLTHHIPELSHTFSFWNTERTFASLGIPAYTIQPGATIPVQAYFKLDPNVPQWENDPLVITFTLAGTTGTISY